MKLAVLDGGSFSQGAGLARRSQACRESREGRGFGAQVPAE